MQNDKKSYVIGFDKELYSMLESVRKLDEAHPFWGRRAYHHIPAMHTELDENQVQGLWEIPGIAYVEEDVEFHTCSEQVPWNIEHLDAPWLHGQGVKGAGVSLAIMDTGVDYLHPDLREVYKGGINFWDGTDDPRDRNGHGTHCAGIAAAEINEEGIIGVAPHVSLYAIQVLGPEGYGSLSAVLSGLDWAIDQDMKIVSMSFSTESYSTSLDDMCEAAWDAGVLLVAAAGNTSGGAVGYPAALGSVIAVSATDDGDKIAPFSAIGPEVEFAAPGIFINSCALDMGFTWKQGTSMACPHISGVAALIWSLDLTKSNAFVREELRKISVDMGPAGRDNCFGWGIPDCYKVAPMKGDFNADGRVNVDDFFLFAGAYGKKAGEEGYVKQADFNKDGVIDLDDFFLFKEYYGDARKE